jgi:S-adenosylmethionine synthetase
LTKQTKLSLFNNIYTMSYQENAKILLTSECVSPMHPDKICDRISDAIVDEYLKVDPEARCAIEVMAGHGKIFITGESNSSEFVSNKQIEIIIEKIIGKEESKGIEVHVNVVRQSREISNGVDTGGAGDQGIVVGFACRDNDAMIPHEHYLARSLCDFIYSKHKADGKTQITIDDNKKIGCAVISWCGVSNEELQKLFTEWVKENEVKVMEGFKIILNGAGEWNVGGIDADTGLTGRKLVVDAYGPRVQIGGGAFSGKDGTKVDKSAALAARCMAVETLKKMPAGVQQVKINVAYSIGVAEPVMVTVEVDGTAPRRYVLEEGELSPEAIIRKLKLKEPNHLKYATEGYIGKGHIWDQGDAMRNLEAEQKAARLKKRVKELQDAAAKQLQEEIDAEEKLLENKKTTDEQKDN